MKGGITPSSEATHDGTSAMTLVRNAFAREARNGQIEVFRARSEPMAIFGPI